MTLSKNETRDLYRRRARRYDLAVRIYPLFGFDLNRYRRDTVAALALRPGDTAVELGCGTGLNFEVVQAAIGPAGKLIGVDLTDAMLAVARERVRKAGWTNVELVQADLAEWPFPAGVGGVYSTLALTLVPEYDAVIARAARALRPEGRLAVFDMREPAGWPAWLVRFAAWLNSPFGVSVALADRHPWESIRRHLTQTAYQEYYFGVLYLCAGENRRAGSAADAGTLAPSPACESRARRGFGRGAAGLAVAPGAGSTSRASRPISAQSRHSVSLIWCARIRRDSGAVGVRAYHTSLISTRGSPAASKRKVAGRACPRIARIRALDVFPHVTQIT
jgi:demethylmenaquinone methyltransferase/2-methoxy-6-polyprenyl-1,4-benzoquinol methylase